LAAQTLSKYSPGASAAISSRSHVTPSTTNDSAGASDRTGEAEGSGEGVGEREDEGDGVSRRDGVDAREEVGETMADASGRWNVGVGVEVHARRNNASVTGRTAEQRLISSL
jgi:hypothetical protein